MNQRTTIGPRGWAILTLAGGAALSSPFLRPAQLKTHDDFATSAAPTPSSQLASYSQLAPATPGWNENANDSAGLFSNGAASSASARVQGAEPSMGAPAFGTAAGPTTAVELPAWAEKESKLDALITAGKAGSPAPSFGTQAEPELLEPLKPWQNDGRSQNVPTPGSPDAALASSRFSPWQDSGTIATAHAASSLPETNWAVDPAADIRAMVLENTPKPLIQPGGLVGATLQRTTEPPSTAEPATPPKFVFQPGMNPE